MPKESPKQSVTVERRTGIGTVLRFKLEPLNDQQVKILEYWRKPKRAVQFKRDKSYEGQVLDFAALKLEETFDNLFDLNEAA